MCVCQGTLLSYWMTCVCLSGDTVELLDDLCVCQGTLLSYWMTCVCLSGDTVELLDDLCVFVRGRC